ncbi:hypothetical protein GH808_06305 [Acetobacterium fimetarium]|uniref:Calcineurin-like phosphoesterase n=1 Tax=Acetobacterium fimetarium TaxID=52691 RepID=A0ABR6WTU8_9FIRM|nr:metallophosphoesterase [Acetobacterium fimetarium]MBC3804048.1 hypothetical protein [Acetobacterium fimetarium]
MIFLSGDIHADFDIQKVITFFGQHTDQLLSKEDYLIILGDAGICWDDGSQDDWVKQALQDLPVTTLFIDGNHENFDLLSEYPVMVWQGGKVHEIEEGILHLMRGQIFEIEGKTFFTFGGGNSVDKENRYEGTSWWPEEMPSYDEYEQGLKTLEEVDYTVDYILTHTAPREVVAEMGIDIYEGEEELQLYLQRIADKTDFEEWYFGHWHMDEDIMEYHCLMEEIVELS